MCSMRNGKMTTQNLSNRQQKVCNGKGFALKTLEKKQTKVNEIDNVLTEEIVRLEKLTKKHVHYVKWENGNVELEVVSIKMHGMKKEFYLKHSKRSRAE